MHISFYIAIAPRRSVCSHYSKEQKFSNEKFKHITNNVYIDKFVFISLLNKAITVMGLIISWVALNMHNV